MISNLQKLDCLSHIFQANNMNYKESIEAPDNWFSGKGIHQRPVDSPQKVSYVETFLYYDVIIPRNMHTAHAS